MVYAGAVVVSPRLSCTGKVFLYLYLMSCKELLFLPHGDFFCCEFEIPSDLKHELITIVINFSERNKESKIAPTLNGF